MFFAWLKRFTPRSLYGRAAMILLVPVVTIQLVVSVVFIQRHYEGITRQMTETLALELSYLVGRVDVAPNLAAGQAEVARLVGPLALDVTLPTAAETGDHRAFWDLSGRIVARELRARVPGVEAVDLLSDSKEVRIVVATKQGPMQITAPRRRVSASNPHQLLVLMVFASALMTLIAYIFLRNQLRPVKRLAEAADAFGKGRVVPYKPSGATEMRLAGTAFLDMRARIERQIEQRTLMLSGVSHDLRTPLTRLKLELSMLEPGPETEALQRDVADMERLLDAFLDFARGDALDDAAEVDVGALVRQAVEDAVRGGGKVKFVAVGPSPDTPDAADAGQGAPTEPLLVHLRPAAVRRALDNLIGNALRYAGRAEVSLWVGETALRITVEDDGPGIPPDQRDEAIKPFIRLDQARNQDRGPGVGLGLAIARDIARRHGGALRLCESERLGGLKVELVLAR
ncbi:ATP-binding protein [Frigidibacter sp. ROC022]|uniref:ATP-binding protein n=1 Tax=Frigidibacter sp. ROC022 TaxID=2971796 RepID=UPI00215AD94D|nr:ATP-binding protein [Frigidibacter sp. ROC022]MCR8726458.1 ATP-binding protein [Frigidibacter sp. ROC022]